MRIRFFACLLVLTCFIPVSGSGQTWLWAKKSGGFPNEESRCIANDPSGNVIIAGAFRTSVMPVGATNLVNRSTTGTSDVMVIKYNSNGTILWATSLGGTANDAGRAVSTDAAGNIYVTGYFRSDIFRFGADSIVNTSTTFADLFVAKISPAGAFIWVKKLSGLVNEFGNGIASDAAGNCYVTGYYTSDTLIVGEDTLLNRAPGALDILVVKLNTQGKFIWGDSYGGPGSDQGQGVVMLPGERIGLTAYYNSDTLRVDSTFLLNPAPGLDDFIAAVLDSSGATVWMKTYGSISDDRAYGIAADNFGNLLLAGRFGSPVLQLDTFALTNFSANLTSDFFVAKIDYTNGFCKWAACFGDSLDEIGEGICADLSGNIYTIGRFSSDRITLGTRTLRNYVSSGTSDIVLTAFDSSGVNKWSVTAGKSANDFGMAVVTKNNRIFITGYFRDTSITFGTFNLINGGTGNQDIFTAALGPPSPLPVDLLSFSGHRTSLHQVVLTWITASETNNDYFILERSKDGMTFEEVTKVAGHKTSVFNCIYEYTDVNEGASDNFYRLKQVDFDGNMTTLPVIFIKPFNVKSPEPVVMANPLPHGLLTIHYESNTVTAAIVSIIDNMGRECKKTEALFRPESAEFVLDLSGLSEGVYLMSFTTTDTIYTTRILIERN